MKNYTYKKQGDNRDSWTCEEFDDNGILINKYMVYENPYESKPKVDLKSILMNASSEEIDYIKQLLK